MSRLLLIDGHNLLFQMFFGMPSRIVGRDGRAVEGVVGFIGALGKIIRMTSPTHVAVIFDSETHNPRCDALPEYKANRPDYSEVPEDENPFTQLPYIYAALDAVGICHTEAVGCECDDIIAAYALSRPEDTEVVISSYDSDYFQLITDDVTVLRYKGDASTVCDKDYIIAKFATRPETYADCKALFGDSADNIKGLFGIGPKTAAKIISTYGPLEKILEDTSVILEEKHRTLIECNRETLKRNLALIRLDAHAPLPFTVDELKFSGCEKRTMEILGEIGVL